MKARLQNQGLICWVIISGRLDVARDAFKVAPVRQRSLVWSRIPAVSLSKILNLGALSSARPNKHVIPCEWVWMGEFTVCYSFFSHHLNHFFTQQDGPPLLAVKWQWSDGLRVSSSWFVPMCTPVSVLVAMLIRELLWPPFLLHRSQFTTKNPQQSV